MTRMKDFKITFEIEPFVKLQCLNTECKFNLINFGDDYMACVLKMVVIDENGHCKLFEPKKDDV
jgi:hypothetical protein